MFIIPDSKACAEKYAEGPDADNEEIELEDFHEVEDEEDKEDVNQYDTSKVVGNYYRAINSLSEIGTTKNIPEELKELVIDASAATLRIINWINSHRE
jgi:hypothetical protein